MVEKPDGRQVAGFGPTFFNLCNVTLGAGILSYPVRPTGGAVHSSTREHTVAAHCDRQCRDTHTVAVTRSPHTAVALQRGGSGAAALSALPAVVSVYRSMCVCR
jgi:hypothetical protein